MLEINKQTSDPELAAVIFMAVEGLRLLNMFDVNPWSKAQTRRTLARMHELAKEAV